MKNLSLKSLVLGAMALVATVSANAGNGTSGNPYTVCATSGFKLTANTVAGASYQWFDANDVAIASATSSVYQLPASNVTTVTTTSYKVQITSAEGCVSEKSTFYVTNIPAPAVAAIANDYSVCGNASQSITLTATPTMAALPTSVTYSYAWTGSNGTGAINNSTAAVANTTSPTTPNAYTYTAAVSYVGIDVPGTGCNATGTTDPVVINAAPAAPTATISASL